MKKYESLFKWLGFLMFALGFISLKSWINIPYIPGYEIWMMITGAVIAFLLGNPLKWLGAAIFIFGYALFAHWISLENQSFSFDPGWVMFGGYLTLFLNSKY
ncbi:MAG: hypothetical protein NW226_25550 [Microscillaceae bacterium]|nr:hypothetical protein [Microscillaceae bacterium]